MNPWILGAGCFAWAVVVVLVSGWAWSPRR